MTYLYSGYDKALVHPIKLKAHSLQYSCSCQSFMVTSPLNDFIICQKLKLLYIVPSITMVFVSMR